MVHHCVENYCLSVPTDPISVLTLLYLYIFPMTLYHSLISCNLFLIYLFGHLPYWII